MDIVYFIGHNIHYLYIGHEYELRNMIGVLHHIRYFLICAMTQSYEKFAILFLRMAIFRIGGSFIFAKSEHQCLANLGRSSFDTSILQDL